MGRQTGIGELTKIPTKQRTGFRVLGRRDRGVAAMGVPDFSGGSKRELTTEQYILVEYIYDTSISIKQL